MLSEQIDTPACLYCRSALQSSGNQSQPVSDVYNSDPKLVSAQEEEEPHYTKVILVSALQEQSCIAEGGNELHYFSVRNKQASLYCRTAKP